MKTQIEQLIRLEIAYENFVEDKVLVQQLEISQSVIQNTIHNQLIISNDYFEGSIGFRNLENQKKAQILELSIKKDFSIAFQSDVLLLFDIYNQNEKVAQWKGIKELKPKDYFEIKAGSTAKIIVFNELNLHYKSRVSPLNYSIYKEFEAVFNHSDGFFYKLQLAKHLYGLVSLLNQQELTVSTNSHLSQSDLSSLIKVEYVVTKSEDFSKTDFSIQHWAEEANMCPTKFKKAFRNLFGETPYQYFQNHRMDVAHRLITQKKLTVSETAYKTGYNSIGRFSMAFQEHFGVMPSKIR